LIGVGKRGSQWLDFASRDRSVLTVAVVDPDSRAIDRARARGLDAFDSTDAALNAAVVVNGAIVACSASEHASVAVRLLEAGIPALIEKPLALSLPDARRVAAAAEDAHLPAMVVQNFRYLPRERAVMRVLDAGTIGNVTGVDVVSTRSLNADDPLWDFSVHHLDALRVRFGPPGRVAARQSQARLSATIWWDDGTCATYRHDDKAAAYTYTERVTGVDGVLTVDDQRVRVSRQVRSRRPRGWIRPGRAPAPEPFILDVFVRAVRGNADATSERMSARDNLQTIALVEAVAEASSRGREIVVPSVVA
jgi:predicted dehydrogenase